MTRVRYDESDGRFELTLPDGWELEKDPEGGADVAAGDGCGLLHLLPFERGPEEEADPAEELYTFLEDQEIELEEDEVEDVELSGAGAAAVCEYLAEEEDELVYWMVFVATAPGQLVFGSYSCPAGEEDQEREQVLGILHSLTFPSPPM